VTSLREILEEQADRGLIDRAAWRSWPWLDIDAPVPRWVESTCRTLAERHARRLLQTRIVQIHDQIRVGRRIDAVADQLEELTAWAAAVADVVSTEPATVDPVGRAAMRAAADRRRAIRDLAQQVAALPANARPADRVRLEAALDRLRTADARDELAAAS